MSVQSLSMAMGQNAPAPPGVLVVRLGHPAHITVDLCALLIGEDGKVADESDFVFYNQPNHPTGAVTISPARGR